MRMFFIDPKYRKVPELMYSNYFTTLKASENSILEAILIKEEEEKALKTN